jgi:DNA-binding CsgD family transcriptional regulator/tetratricopeptide (TPR) repeat protein
VRSASVVVGRELELDHLRRVIGAARSGQSSCTVIVGEGGVGKSRLLAEAIAIARQLSLDCAVGRAPVSAPAPFSILTEALRSWLRGHPRAPTDTPFDQGLRLVLPEWPSTRDPTDLTAQQLQLLALEGVVIMLRAIASSGNGGVLVLDDLHAADPDSVELVRYVSSAEVDGLAIVAALRPSESALADQLVRGLRGQASTTVLELEPLDSREVTNLIAGLLDAAPPPELVADVMVRTDGVPLLVEEVVDAHARAGSLALDAGGAHWRGGVGMVVPRSVRGMVESRLEQVPPYVRAVLVAAAVLGRFDRTSAVGAVAESSAAVVREALQRGVDVGLLATRGGTIGFRHDLLREAVLDATLPHVLSTLHLRAAEVCAEPAAAGAHFAAAGDRGGAIEAYVTAALQELRNHALLSAEKLARTALEMAEVTATRVVPADALATILTAQGRWAEALAVDDVTVAESGQTDQRRQRMASAALEAGYPDRARAVLEGTDVNLPLSRVLVGRVALVGGDAATALTHADAVVTQSVDLETRLAALDLQGRALDYLGKRTAAKAAWTTQATEAAAHHRTQPELRAVFQLGRQEFFDGGRPLQLRKAVELARKAGALVELAWAEETLAIALTLQGDPNAALEVLEDAIPRARELRLDQLGFLVTARAGALGLMRESADELFAEAAALTSAPDVRLTILSIKGDLAMQQGRYADALMHFQAAHTLLATMPGAAPMDTTCHMVWALAGLGRLDEARAALRRAEALPDLRRWYMRPVLVEAARGLLAGDAGPIDVAIASAPGPMPYAIAVIRTIGAEVLGGDLRVPWLREALDIYEAVGATVPRERIRRLLRAAGGAVPRRRTPGLGVPETLRRRGVTEREAEVLRLLGTGASNADIAARLFVSIRTVETHVSSLLSKLDARSRGQLTALSATIAFGA